MIFLRNDGNATILSALAISGALLAVVFQASDRIGLKMGEQKAQTYQDNLKGRNIAALVQAQSFMTFGAQNPQADDPTTLPSMFPDPYLGNSGKEQVFVTNASKSVDGADLASSNTATAAAATTALAHSNWSYSGGVLSIHSPGAVDLGPSQFESLVRSGTALARSETTDIKFLGPLTDAVYPNWIRGYLLDATTVGQVDGQTKTVKNQASMKVGRLPPPKCEIVNLDDTNSEFEPESDIHLGLKVSGVALGARYPVTALQAATPGYATMATYDLSQDSTSIRGINKLTDMKWAMTVPRPLAAVDGYSNVPFKIRVYLIPVDDTDIMTTECSLTISVVQLPVCKIFVDDPTIGPGECTDITLAMERMRATDSFAMSAADPGLNSLGANLIKKSETAYEFCAPTVSAQATTGSVSTAGVDASVLASMKSATDPLTDSQIRAFYKIISDSADKLHAMFPIPAPPVVVVDATAANNAATAKTTRDASILIASNTAAASSNANATSAADAAAATSAHADAVTAAAAATTAADDAAAAPADMVKATAAATAATAATAAADAATAADATAATSAAAATVAADAATAAHATMLSDSAASIAADAVVTAAAVAAAAQDAAYQAQVKGMTALQNLSIGQLNAFRYSVSSSMVNGISDGTTNLPGVPGLEGLSSDAISRLQALGTAAATDLVALQVAQLDDSKSLRINRKWSKHNSSQTTMTQAIQTSLESFPANFGKAFVGQLVQGTTAAIDYSMLGVITRGGKTSNNCIAHVTTGGSSCPLLGSGYPSQTRNVTFAINGNSGYSTPFTPGPPNWEVDSIASSPYTTSLCPVDSRCYALHDFNGGNLGSRNLFVTLSEPNSASCTATASNRDSLGCFAYHSKITMGDGSKKEISQIAAGDMVWNPQTKKPVRVASTTSGPEKESLVVISSGDFTLSVTTKHPVPTKTGIKSAVLVGTNDEIQDTNGSWHKVSQVRRAQARLPVINLWLDTPSQEAADHLIVADGIVAGDLFLQQKLEEEQRISADRAEKVQHLKGAENQ